MKQYPIITYPQLKDNYRTHLSPTTKHHPNRYQTPLLKNTTIPYGLPIPIVFLAIFEGFWHICHTVANVVFVGVQVIEQKRVKRFSARAAY